MPTTRAHPAQKFALVLAGPLANVLAAVFAIAAMTLVPVTINTDPIIRVQEVIPGSPAEQAGLRAGEHILSINGEEPTQRDWIRRQASQAALTGDPLELRVADANIDNPRVLQLVPDLDIGLGIMYHRVYTGQEGVSYSPTDIGQRFLSINENYWLAMAEAVNNPHRMVEEEPLLSGPLLSAQMTGETVSRAGLFGWLAILALLNLSVAVVNLVPIPPLDGFKLATTTLETLRGGRELSQQLQYQLTIGGIALIVVLAGYLVVRDLQIIMG